MEQEMNLKFFIVNNYKWCRWGRNNANWNFSYFFDLVQRMVCFTIKHHTTTMVCCDIQYTVEIGLNVKEFAVIRVVLIVLCERTEHGLIGWFFDVIMAGIQSIHAVATVGIKFVSKLIVLVAMVAIAVNTTRRT